MFHSKGSTASAGASRNNQVGADSNDRLGGGRATSTVQTSSTNQSGSRGHQVSGHHTHAAPDRSAQSNAQSGNQSRTAGSNAMSSNRSNANTTPARSTGNGASNAANSTSHNKTQSQHMPNVSASPSRKAPGGATQRGTSDVGRTPHSAAPRQGSRQPVSRSDSGRDKGAARTAANNKTSNPSQGGSSTKDSGNGMHMSAEDAALSRPWKKNEPLAYGSGSGYSATALAAPSHLTKLVNLTSKSPNLPCEARPTPRTIVRRGPVTPPAVVNRHRKVNPLGVTQLATLIPTQTPAMERASEMTMLVRVHAMTKRVLLRTIIRATKTAARRRTAIMVKATTLLAIARARISPEATTARCGD
ncbi:hypothetical protein IE81DRAFT_59179 [Ceraceosorus guamensis]|uniref:Uncharacterized protein n=1 Tax=Ceraceosorus guamensis TaxID=1522189 RepID=A0A316W1M1_9BASI|nr:hypothetical protein IE81DRAFT_59179 [Ceraceosorus guamensis]PWN43797.1 hypothetical protein IE81DRAFT_59179 [Ceraceosorus guamensis]